MKTKELLLITAERLFSEQSIDSVSLRQITMEAGQKNISALSYHFGTKEDLITAIFDYRMPPINEYRLAYLEQLKKDSRQHDLNGLMEALIYPLATHLKPGGSPYYIGFQEGLISSYTLKQKRQFFSKYDQGIVHLSRLIKETLKDFPMDLINLRIGLIIEQNILYLSEWRRIIKERGHQKPIYEIDYYTSNMVSMFAESLKAPVPAELESE